MMDCGLSSLFLHKRSLHQWILQLFCLLLAAPGGAVSQISDNVLCTSPLMRGGRIFISDIPENLAVGTTIGNLQLLGSSSEILLRYFTQNPNINIDPASQNLTIRARLDREKYDFIDITVTCEMLANRFTIPIEIKITIADVNDNAPVFIGAPYSTNISELMPVGATVLTGIQAADADSDNWKVTFEILNDTSYSDHFAFPTETGGSLILTKPLDYEILHSIQLHVIAKDNHPSLDASLQPQLSTTTTVTIHVYDGDDQNPAFSRPSYLAYVTENSPIGTAIEVLPPLEAADLDLGLNTSVAYSFIRDSIFTPPMSDYFDINSVTGFITLRYDVLRRGEQFALGVKASQVDNPDRYSTTTLYIQVQAANENQPHFLEKLYSVSLLETVPVQSYVTTVSARDNDVVMPQNGTGFTLSLFDEGSVLTYKFTRPELVSDFTIDPKTGVIRTVRELSYEKQPRYNVSISVTDGRFFDYTFLILDLINVNNNNPVFDEEIYRFQGHKEPNFYLGKVKAVDVDVGSIVTYRLVMNSTLFALRPNGEIYLEGNPDDINDDDVITLYVVAADDGSPPRQDAAVVMLTFGVGSAVTMAAQTDLVVIIILGVLSGCLLLIIAVLSVYIYRNKSNSQVDAPHNYSPEIDHIDAYFETSKSFERGINDLPVDYHSNTYVNAAGIYKPTSKDRHLAMYNDMPIERDSTTVQENPFTAQHHGSQSSRPRSQARGKTLPHDSNDTVRSYTGYIAPNGDPYYRPDSRGSDPRSSRDDTRLPHRDGPHGSGYSMARESGMHAVNEIDYDSALAAMDDASNRDYSSPSGSDPSFRESGASLGTFKVGNSTQALVPPHSPAGSSVNMFRGKGSSVSFIDDHQVNVYHPDNAINPDSRDKPEITVYY